MIKCPFQPSSEGYSADEPRSARTAQLDGPRGLYAPGVLGTIIEVQARWRLTRADYQTLMSFYNARTTDGQTFLIDLLIDQSYVQEHTAQFVPGSFRLASKSGDAREAEAVLEVLQIQQSTSYYNQIVSFRDVPDAAYGALIHLVEVALPDDL